MSNQMSRSKSLSIPSTSTTFPFSQQMPSRYMLQPSPPPKKPIPAAKVEKASRLYYKYLQEEGLAQRNRDAQSTIGGSYLRIPSSAPRVPKAMSVSTTPDMGDMSSVISFTETDSQISGNGREHTAFNGQKVKKRLRNKLSPTAKAKAALVRYLGSCVNCRARNVSCPLEHHDIESLEHKARVMQYPSTYPGSDSSTSTPPGAAAQTFIHNAHNEVPKITNVNDQFFYPGHLAQETIAHNTASGLANDLARLETNVTRQEPPTLSLTPTTPTLSLRPMFPTRAIQGPDMVYIGNKLLSEEIGWYFKCAHDNCLDSFATRSQLEDHYEVHEEYERLQKPSYNVCSRCRALNQDVFHGYCDNSGCGGSMEMRILGRRLPPLLNESYFPDSQAVRGDVFDSIYTGSFYLPGQSPSIDTSGSDHNNLEYFNYESGFDQGSASSNPESGSWNGYLHSNYGAGSDGYQYQGNGFNQVKPQALLASSGSQYIRRILQISRRYKAVLFVLVLSTIIMAAFRVHRSFIPHPQTEILIVSAQSPKLGFLGLLGSIPLFWSIKLTNAKRARSKRMRCPITRYSRPVARQYLLESGCQSYTVESNVLSSWIA